MGENTSMEFMRDSEDTSHPRAAVENAVCEKNEQSRAGLLADLPPISVPLPMRVQDPWTTDEAERSLEAMGL
jgi:hypothetical protein